MDELLIAEDMALLIVPGPSRGVDAPPSLLNEDERDTEGRDPGVVEPWLGNGGTGLPDGLTSSR